MAHTDDFDMARVCVFEHVCKSVCVCKCVRAGVREREKFMQKVKESLWFCEGLELEDNNSRYPYPFRYLLWLHSTELKKGRQLV